MINESKRRNKILARIFGNFGTSFFGPLVSGNVAETMFDVGLSFEESLIIALFAGIFNTGYVMFGEVKAYGERKN